MSLDEAGQSAATLDATGLICPEPVMLLHKAVRDLPDGAALAVIATDPSTQRDIPKFCDFLGHTLVKQEVRGEGGSGQQFHYLIQKGDPDKASS